jgi:hypothetical protein
MEGQEEFQIRRNYKGRDQYTNSTLGTKLSQKDAKPLEE